MDLRTTKHPTILTIFLMLHVVAGGGSPRVRSFHQQQGPTVEAHGSSAAAPAAPGVLRAPGALPPVFDMGVNLRQDIFQRSCADCSTAHPLGAGCCGVCGFWKTGHGASARHPWNAPCRNTGALLEHLHSVGIDLWGFRPEDLFESLRGRTLWLIGDSQTERFYAAVECFLSPFLTDAHRHAPTNATSANLWLVNRDDRLDVAGDEWAEPVMPVCAHYHDKTRVCLVRVHRAGELAHPALRVLRRKSGPGFARDVAVLNAGLHYPVGSPQYAEDLRFLTGYVANNRAALPRLIWKDTAPQHFHYERGYYLWPDKNQHRLVTGSEEVEGCRPLTAEELSHPEIQSGGWYNSEAFPILREANISVWDTHNVTMPLWQYHMWEKDCTHFCHPSAYELWTYLLYKFLVEHSE